MDETPFMSSIGKTKATAIYHEWQTDQLDTPGSSRIAEGTDYIEPTVAGGTGLASSATSNTVTLAIDNTVTTLTGTQTLTNKTLTSPTINGGSLDSAVTGATQSSGTNNTTIATTAFATTVAVDEATALAIALG